MSIPNDKNPNDDFYSNFGNGDDPAQEEEQIRERLLNIFKKLTSEDNPEITNIDILQYLRAMNFNFITLSKLLHSLHVRQSLFEEILLRIDTKLSQFLESSNIIDEVMTDGHNNPS